ncbi:hypothetical protein [Halomonas ramblicola]|uniref:hypothetical protein n=1 Tax=Halomonas ramblicola TaxID=747349 RepID=UPI0025B2A7FF|nr:hypothetical protein [Halomonas ramblicola]MDN3523393.1 hypothetical protein [Halomonas ramblicola]
MKSRAAIALATGQPLEPTEIDVDDFITHDRPFERIDEAFDPLQAGKSIRTVLH